MLGSLRASRRNATCHAGTLLNLRRPESANHARTFFTIVKQGYEGWRLTLGQNPVKLDPGLRLMIPFLHSVQEVDMRETSVSVAEGATQDRKSHPFHRLQVNITDLAGFTSDNVPVLVSGSLFFRVKDSYHACFRYISSPSDNCPNNSSPH